MKKILYFVWLMVGLALLPACQRSNKLEDEAMRQDSINAVLQDSINTANAEKDSLMQLMGDIADGMQQIKELEDIVSVNNLNVCYYVVGSKKELKDHKIVESGFLRKTKILQGDFEMSYFTKADRRTLSEIPLHSSKAEVMTNHPHDSYEIVEHGNVKTLHILNSARFWEKSNFLVVKVD